MCGIAGILHFGARPDAPARVAKMARAMIHRGPDDEGFWCDNDVAFGFRRLSIVDLATGAQPMGNEDGAVQVIFNGEIYNHLALRRELEAAGHAFRTDHSDTEVLVHGYEQWGLGLLNRLNGMFAFAVWDQRSRALLLARDRLGIKPLHVAELADSVLFASDIRALHASGLVPCAADPGSVLEYFQQQNVWAGRSMFAGVRSLEAGSFLRLWPNGRQERSYWDVRFQRRRSSRDEAARALRGVIQESLARQLAADVPVMAYLSGGIDSSSIVAGAFRRDSNIKAYSCIFDLTGVGEDRLVDEREFSRLVARDLGICHIELELPADDLQRSLLPTVRALEEPRMGMAYVNYRIAERVAQDGKVVLSGCGGDEILAGYVGRYGVLRDRLNHGAPLPNFLAKLRSLFSSVALRPHEIRDAMFPLFSYPITESELDQAFTSEFRRAAGDYRLRDGLDALVASCPSPDPWDTLMYTDIKTYLRGLLIIEDKLSMAHGLETRVPLIDNDVIDFALDVDWSLLTDGATGKIVFREAIRDWVPREIADKPKMGFGPPDASWYRGRLQPYVREALDPHRIAKRGVFRPDFVRSAIEDHMTGRSNKLPLIWSLLSFEAWCEDYALLGGDLGTPLAAIGAAASDQRAAL